MRTVEEQHHARAAADGGASEGPDPEALKPLGEEAPEVVQMGARIGARRLDRPLIGDAMTSFIGGMSVSFGAVALAWAAAATGGSGGGSRIGALAGALAFPVGFLILLIGKGELFTENFFLPVTAVLERRGRVGQLASLWAVSLAFNLLGALVFAFLVSRPGVLDAAPARELFEIAEAKCGYGLETAFIKAVFAGWLMTLLTWMLVAARGLGPRLVIIWSIAALIVLGRFNHVVISAAEIFMAILLGAPVTAGAWFLKNFLPALGGNLVGGLVFVTLLFYVQAQHHHPDPERHDDAPGSKRRPVGGRRSRELGTRRRDWSL